MVTASIKIAVFSSARCRLNDFFHYRNLDVSTLKELAKRWNPAAASGFSKRNTHQALDDIRESLAELKHYRQTFLKLAE